MGLTTEDFAFEIEESKANAAKMRLNYAKRLEATGDRDNILYDKINADYTSPLFTYRYVSSNANKEILENTIWKLRFDYSNIYTLVTITAPTSLWS